MFSWGRIFSQHAYQHWTRSAGNMGTARLPLSSLYVVHIGTKQTFFSSNASAPLNDPFATGYRFPSLRFPSIKFARGLLNEVEERLFLVGAAGLHEYSQIKVLPLKKSMRSLIRTASSWIAYAICSAHQTAVWGQALAHYRVIPGNVPSQMLQKLFRTSYHIQNHLSRIK